MPVSEDWNQQVETIEVDQFRELGQILDAAVIGREILRAGDPADVGPEEALLAHRVLVFGVIGVLVMVAMRRGPPERTALDASAAPDREDELHETRGAEGSVGEIPVEETGDRKHPDEIEGDCREDGRPAPAGPDHTQTTQVEDEKWQGADPFDLLRFVLEGEDTFGVVVGVHPLRHGCFDVFEGTNEYVIGHVSQTVFGFCRQPTRFIA